MIIFSDSRDPIFNSRDPNRVPKTQQLCDVLRFHSTVVINVQYLSKYHPQS